MMCHVYPARITSSTTVRLAGDVKALQNRMQLRYQDDKDEGMGGNGSFRQDDIHCVRWCHLNPETFHERLAPFPTIPYQQISFLTKISLINPQTGMPLPGDAVSSCIRSYEEASRTEAPTQSEPARATRGAGRARLPEVPTRSIPLHVFFCFVLTMLSTRFLR